MTEGATFLQALLFALGVILAVAAAFLKVDSRLGWAGVACVAGGLLVPPLSVILAA